MKRYSPALVALLALAGCSTPPRPVALAPEEPLEISILPPPAGYGFWVNAPAYVAMFDIAPGAGVDLIYPRTNYDLTRAANAGSSWIHTSFSFHRYAYYSGSSLDQTHYLVAVASRKPLNIRQAAGYSDWITYKLGMSAFSGTGFSIMRSLFDEVVPVQPADDWATAVYVVYPNVRWRDNIYQYVRCPDGSVYLVNILAGAFSCPAPVTQAVAQKPGDNQSIHQPDQPKKGSGGSSIARGISGNDLTFLHVVSDVMYRPPTPDPNRFGPSGVGGGGIRTMSDSRSSYPGYSPSPQPVENPAVSRPQIEASQSPPPAPPSAPSSGGSSAGSGGGKSSSPQP